MLPTGARQTEHTQLPSLDELRSAQKHVTLSPEARRLFWSLEGSFNTSVRIMASESNPDSLEPCAQQSSEDGTMWHPATHAPLTNPKVSSVTVHVDTIDEWENNWLAIHQDHADPDQADENGEANGGEAKFGELADYDSDSDEEGPVHLLKCCTTVRPRGKKTSVVVEPGTGVNECVTIRDYLSTVHPWLMSMHEDIRWAVNVHNDNKPWPEEKKLAVDYNAPESLMVVDRDDWMDLARKRNGRQETM